MLSYVTMRENGAASFEPIIGYVFMLAAAPALKRSFLFLLIAFL